MTFYRKKPVEIQAWQWNPGDPETAGAVVGTLMAHGVEHRCVGGTGASTRLLIDTLEGPMTAQPGDWIIRGVQGEFYPCKPDIFEATYEPVEEAGTR